MKKHIILVLFKLLFYSQDVYSQEFTRDEFLGEPTDKSISILFRTRDSVFVRAEFGTSSLALSDSTEWKLCTAKSFTKITINNLKSNSKYYYRLTLKNLTTGLISYRRQGEFSTQKSPDQEFVFTIQADPHLDEQSDTALYKICLQNQLDDRPDFMIDLGDFLMTDKLRNSDKKVTKDTILFRANLLRKYYELISHTIPVFIALGNHEGECGWYGNNTDSSIAVWGTNIRKEYFLNPAPSTFYSGDTMSYPFVGQRASYYSWTWGNSLFIVLDPYWHTAPKPDSLHGWYWTLGKEQYNWLRRTLQNSTATFKFVFAHQLVGGDPEGRGGIEYADLYEWGGKNLDGSEGFSANRPTWYKPIKDLLQEFQTTVFFHGHDHFFAKQEKECLIYQEVPQPSHPNFQTPSLATEYGYINGVILPNSGHIRVRVQNDGVTVEYVRAYIPQNENSKRHNKDVSSVYRIPKNYCYSTTTSVSMIENSQYESLVYPNPFVFETTIKFSAPIQGNYSLSIYSLDGIKIRELFSHVQLQSGTFSTTWNGCDNSEVRQPFGTYLYVLTDSKNNIVHGVISFLP